MRLLLSLLALTSCVLGSQYSPHKYPGTSPWFEGWYTRVTVSDQASSSALLQSIGIIVGHYPNQTFAAPSSYAAFLIQQQGKPLEEVHMSVGQESIQLLPDGVDATNPDDASPPDFSLVASSDGSSSFKMTIDGDEASISGQLGDYQVSVVISDASASAWGANGEGPEGWVSHLGVIGLSWFVYALSAPAQVTVTHLPTNTVLANRASGFAHMEKNWGNTFPKGWIWLEGMRIAADSNEPDVTLALAGGYAEVIGITVANQYLIGYRSANLTWNFHPQDPAVFTQTANDACDGNFGLTARSLGRRLTVEVTADPASFGGVQGPTGNGFSSDSVESFQASIVVSAYSVNPLLPLSDGDLLETVSFSGALEFGGIFQCSSS
eukprot:TRINITY_DN2212_c0_g1_i1.p1 TRINITY_DN2212_c0_g1~~TRINITY_DN2212_c0_g1_i1.p1  ORF type:complete len:379 (-),score=60.73 TRINITY_DN2212_c0_g1_i1:238-1374(-)